MKGRPVQKLLCIARMDLRLFTRREFLSDSAYVAAWLGVGRRLAATTLPEAREITLTARETTVEISPGQTRTTWAYDGRVPGPEIRVREGERVRITLRNELPAPTSIHWHGVPVPNAMDGVAGVTQAPVSPGDSFTYEFDASPAGTYFYHSHVGLQLDRGLYGPLIIEPREDAGATADREYVLLLDDWLDITPEQAFAELQQRSPMRGGMMGGSDDPLYAAHLVNGRTGGLAAPLAVARGERVRLRLINAGSATTFRVGLAGHRLTVTHADGQRVRPIDVDTLVIGVGERYDVQFVAGNPGVWPLVAGSIDSPLVSLVVPLVYERTLDSLRPVTVWPSELSRGRALRYVDLVPVERMMKPAPGVVQTIPITLGSAMMGGYVWTINGQAYPNADPIGLDPGARVRLRVTNATMMRHPLHLHGHFFTVRLPGQTSGPAKDTVVVDPMASFDLDFVADNPGRWFFHCHHLYHMEGGMARTLEYR